jgi:hypothetical protein
MITVDERTRPLHRGGFPTPDSAIAAVILCVGIWLGTRAVETFRADGGHASFYQSEFGPAVMFACGRGFQNPDIRNAPALADFLSERADALDCSTLPQTMPIAAFDPFQRASRYLQMAVAVTWRLRGVSWPRLALLSGLFFGAVAALTYCIFRLALSRTFALLGMVPILMSTSNLMLAPHIRDYAKGPFLLAAILGMGLLVVGPTDRQRALVISALLGGVVGLGLGFRTDLIIALVPIVLTVALLLNSLSILARLATIIVFLSSFAAVASPMLFDYSSGNNIGPVTLLGLTAPFDEPLGVGSSVYEFGGLYNDSLIFTIVNSYVVRVENRHEGVDLATREHGAASMKYLGHIAAVFPADFVTRTLAAARAVPRYFLESSLYPPPWIRSSVVRHLYRLRGSVSSRLSTIAVAGVVTATIAVSMVDPRFAWLIVVIMIGFAGASAVQFNERHFFYLQFVPWCAFGFLAQNALRAPTAFRQSGSTPIRPALVFAVTVSLGVVGALTASRLYQQRTAARLFELYEAAPRTPLNVEQQHTESGRVLLANPEWLQPMSPLSPLSRDADRVETRFLAVQFRDDLCGPAELPLTVRYRATLPELDFSERIAVRLPEHAMPATVFFFAAYDRPDNSSRFSGVEIEPGDARCIGGLFQVEGLARTPMLLTTTLTASWRREALYQRLR